MNQTLFLSGNTEISLRTSQHGIKDMKLLCTHLLLKDLPHSHQD